MKITRDDVAKLAGVSNATVSYVLNGSRNISEKTKRRVLGAVKQLQYKPDMIARSLSKRESMQLSLMIDEIANPFYSEIIHGFEAAAIEKNYFVNVCTGYKNINSYLDNYIARRIDGVFVAAVPHKFDMQKLYNLTEYGIKVVMSGDVEADFKRVSSIENDYVGGMQTAIEFLAGIGHERIAYLSALDRTHMFDRRIPGFLDAMERQGLDCGKELLFEGNAPYSSSLQDGYNMAKELISSGKNFSAAICTNDLMAMGAISAFEDFGLSVPDDVSVMGFDDILFSSAWRPSITTMAVSKYKFGRKAFELLYTNITQGNTGYYLNPLELKVRSSTGDRH